LTKTKGVPRPNYVSLCFLYHPKKKQAIDQATLVYYKAPKSFTGEDSLEITIHGGVVIANRLIDACLSFGVRGALPGEFSYRAFINNKIDLLQAEAIASIVNSTNDLDSYYSLSSIRGNLSGSIQKSCDIIRTFVTRAEHELDFVDGEINFTGLNAYLRDLESAKAIIKEILDRGYTIEDNKTNFKVVIIGLPNVGKSSLFNVLIGRSKAIVTNIKGTTRDVLEQQVYIKDSFVSLLDTAGIRRPRGRVEKIGVKKTFMEIEHGDIIILVDDRNTSKVFNQIKDSLIEKTVILVHNKLDKQTNKKEAGAINVSCKERTGIKELITCLSTEIEKKVDSFSKHHSCLINKRQVLLLEKIYGGLGVVGEDYKENKDLALCLSLLYGVLDNFNTLIRPINKNEILNDIFGGFCVGK
jgi:tRNA modification GTPase